MHNPNYYRKGFGLKDAVKPELAIAYDSELISSLRQNRNSICRDGITVMLAEAFGFCWGVDRAVSMAYETRKQFPDRQIWITNEIIHNPLVNENLREMGIGFVHCSTDGTKDFSNISDGDVVILPAFGASVEEMALLETKKCEIVDTTCPWVSRVWSRVAKYEQNEFTAMIHGKYNHEETIATSSRSRHYLIIQNLKEAEWVCNFILNGGSSDEFLERFKSACSEGFDPAIHLDRVGIANQTTILKNETEQIGKLVERTMMQRFGPENLDKHFLSPGDTICDATEERQNAMLKLVDNKLDLMLIIGGFNSSNTGHLREIAESRGLVSYHIDGPHCMGPGNVIRHQTSHSDSMLETRNWLPEGDVLVGVTAGASTPDQVVAQVLEIFLRFEPKNPKLTESVSKKNEYKPELGGGKIVEDKKAALVTGAAKRLGREIVLYLADRGFDIGVHYLGSHDMAAELVETVKAKGRQCVMVKADLSNPEQIGGLVQNVASQLPHLSLLVNNASIFNGVSFLDTSTKLFDDNFNVHVKTPFFLTQEFAKVCGRGQVVNIVDMAVNFNSTGYFAYLLSKKSLHAFTEMAALALGPNIRVNSIAPGSTLQPVDEEESSYMEERAKQIPLQMPGGPQYITTALGYLLDNAFVTGDCLYVDGGAHL